MNLFLKSLIATMVISVAFSTASFAASYNAGKVGITYADTNKLTETSQNEMLTVMVVKKEVALDSLNSDSILYLDQGTGLSTFLAAGSSQFGVKGGSLEAGTYAMYIGSTSMENPSVQYFTVATAESEDNTVTSSTGVEFVTKTKESSGIYETTDTDEHSLLHNGSSMYDYIFLVNVGNSVNTDLFDYTVTLKYNSNDNIYSKSYLIPDGMLPQVNIEGDAAKVYGIVVKGVPETCENFRIEPSVSVKEVQQ